MILEMIKSSWIRHLYFETVLQQIGNIEFKETGQISVILLNLRYCGSRIASQKKKKKIKRQY